MDLDVWISFEDEKITKWEGGDWAKDTVKEELAETRSPFFPLGHDAYRKVDTLINSGKYESDRIDSLTRYVMVPRFEILKIIDELHCNIQHINERLDELKKYVDKLPDKDFYKLVQQEF